MASNIIAVLMSRSFFKLNIRSKAKINKKQPTKILRYFKNFIVPPYKD